MDIHVQTWRACPRLGGISRERMKRSEQRTNLVEHLVKLAELGHLLHDLLPHEEGRVHGCEATLVEDAHGVLHQGRLQEQHRALRGNEMEAVEFVG